MLICLQAMAVGHELLHSAPVLCGMSCLKLIHCSNVAYLWSWGSVSLAL